MSRGAAALAGTHAKCSRSDRDRGGTRPAVSDAMAPLDHPAPLVFHVVMWTVLFAGLIAVMVVVMLN